MAAVAAVSEEAAVAAATPQEQRRRRASICSCRKCGILKTTPGPPWNSAPPIPAIRCSIRAAYGKGTFYALAVPDDFADIYRLPQSVLTQIRNLLGRDIFVQS